MIRGRTLALLAAAVLIAAACSDSAAQSPAPTSAAAAAATTPASTTAPTTVAPTTTEDPIRHLTVAFSGDVLPHSPLWNKARSYAGGNGYDFSPMFKDIAPLVSGADLAICHLETPIVPPGEEPQTYPRYGVPKEIVAAIKSAGYDRCSTASNHAMDQGPAGVEATLAAFDEAGLTQAGMARNAEEAEPHLIEVNGIKIAHLSYTRAFPTLDMPAGEPWWANNIDIDRILADARKARDMGADIVIVSMHWGTEPQHEPNDTQRAQADALTASGLIDLVVGHHTHVIQPIEQVNGVWTVFGMGNSLSNMPVGPYPPESQDGVVVEVSFDVAPDGTVTVAKPVVYPTIVDKGYTFEIKDVLKNLARPDLTPRERAFYEASLERTTSYVGAGFIATEPFNG
jgi:poly-gamma-glutamate synthesis protein (capsule biosynthesis protein)